MLVHELTRLSEIKVPRFRPMTAETPNDFQRIGETLGVDAIVTGDIKTLTDGENSFLEIAVQIFSGQTGHELWSKTMQTESADNLLEQSKLAADIASVIGQRLTSTGEQLTPPNVQSFNCLVDGKTRSDLDSPKGLEMALMCFQDAHGVAPRFADPIAGIALTSITLAAQTDRDKSIELIRQARDRSDEALTLDPRSLDARLAMAMLDWQTVGRFDKAKREFQELAMIAPNNWQVRHQQGLLQLATNRNDEAMKSLREASQLNPLSVSLKIDRIRALWYLGNTQRAIRDAQRIRDRYDNNPIARGLLIDIYEQQEDFALAASQDAEITFTDGDTSTQYFDRRTDRLVALPYGPFGTVANTAILETRRESSSGDQKLAQWLEPLHPPMLPLLLQAHPTFQQIRTLELAQEIMFQSPG